MDPIKNNGAMDYTMTMPQQNNVQPTPEEDYSSMPMVYDPTMDEKKESAKSGIALKALAAVGIAGLAMWAGHSMGQKGVKAAKEAEDLAVKAKDEAVKAKDEALAKAKKLQEANDAAYEIADKKHTGIFDGKKALREDIKKALRPEEAEAKKATEAAKKEANDAAAKAEDAAENVAEEAK